MHTSVALVLWPTATFYHLFFTYRRNRHMSSMNQTDPLSKHGFRSFSDEQCCNFCLPNSITSMWMAEGYSRNYLLKFPYRGAECATIWLRSKRCNYTIILTPNMRVCCIIEYYVPLCLKVSCSSSRDLPYWNTYRSQYDQMNFWRWYSIMTIVERLNPIK